MKPAMGTRVVLYDMDSKRRDFVSAALFARGIEFESCYSIEKVKHTINRIGDDPFVLVTPSPIDSDFSSVIQKQGPSVVLISDNIHMLPDSTFILARMFSEIDAAKNAARPKHYMLRQGTGKYDLVLIGSSTGGFPVVQEILQQFRTERLIVVVCQHISASMSDSLACALNAKMLMPCNLIKEQTELHAGKVYLLSGGVDFELKEKYGKLYIVPSHDEESAFHPSFNKLTGSLLDISNLTGCCFVLSGLGADGSKHLFQLQKKGIAIIAQDPEGAVAPGMPKAAIQTGAVSEILGITELYKYLGKMAA